MRYSIAIATAGLLGVVNAGHHDHALFHKRHNNQTEQCSTVWSTWYGEPTMVPLPPPPSSSSSSTTTTTTTSSSTSSVPTSTSTTSTSSSSTSSSVAPTTSSKAPAAPSAVAAIQQGGGSSGTNFFGHSTGSSGMNAITFTPYTGSSQAASQCMTGDAISAAVHAINAQGFNTIRLYATDCNQLSSVGPVAAQLGMHLILGIFVNSPGSADSDFATQFAAIKSFIGSNGASNIDAILVGNEPFASDHATVAQISSYLQQTKAAFPNLSVSCPLTHAELTQYGGQLCSKMDIVAAQIHPFFSTSYVAPSGAGSYVESEMSLMSQICGGKPTFVSESGYPSGGGSYLSQLAGALEQEIAIGSLRSSSKASSITVFSSSPDGWKLAPGVQEYEAMFNCLNLF